MQEKFRLRADLNAVALTDADIETVTDALGKYENLKVYHRYYYLLKGYHELVHGIIDDEAFFVIGDISATRSVFASAPRSSLEAVFLIEEDIAHSTLYIVEQSARSYYISKSTDGGKHLKKELAAKHSHILAI